MNKFILIIELLLILTVCVMMSEIGNLYNQTGYLADQISWLAFMKKDRR